MSAISELAAAALRYAEHGLPVFPCRPRGKEPLGDLAPNGFKDATSDLDAITRWWKKAPSANIGIATGKVVDVVDLDDVDEEGHCILGAYIPPDAPELDGPTYKTSRGAHLWIAPTGLPSRTGALPGMDYKARSGYVIVPPSVHPSGARYTWLMGEDDSTFGAFAPLCVAPEWLLSILRKPERAATTPAVREVVTRGSNYGRRALEAEVGRVALAPVGQRNDALNAAAYALGQLIAGGALDANEVAAALLLAAERAGLEAGEARATIASGLLSGAAAPRGVPA
jgi:hypothetical protein